MIGVTFPSQNQLAYLLYSKSDLKRDLLERIGLKPGELSKPKLKFSRSAIDRKAPSELKHWESPHTMSL